MAAMWFPIVIIDLINQFRGRAYAERVRSMSVTPSARGPEPPRSNIDRLLDSAAVSDGFYLSLSRPF